METNRPSAHRDAVKTVNRCMTLLHKGIFSEKDCFLDMVRMAIRDDEETWRGAISAIPVSLRLKFLEYLRSYLVPVDFMPMPTIVLPPPRTPEKEEALKQERRPKYMKLFQLLEEMCVNVQA